MKSTAFFFSIYSKTDTLGSSMMKTLFSVFSVLVAASVMAADLQPPKSVEVKPASNEGTIAMKGFELAPGLKLSLVAAEPLLANPVAFDIDEQGRFYVVESFRLHKGVMDIRGHMNWLDEELASQSTEEMRAMFRRYKVPGLTDYSDRVRQLVDRDGDGVMDHATVFADGFNDEVDGLAAGVLARNGKVWFTNIPHLWLLEDKNGDGKADTKQSLASGFGVRVGFLGHDLHGLRQGPDGRIYFSIGDRAASVTTKDGRKLHTPEYGTIYRCEPDGSDLELYHIGLRNPQELAFDAHGNLFTGDNNSDGGDPARWVNAVEGGDSGWRIGWQFLEGAPWTTRRGPWLDERMCFPDGKAAHRIPPVANIGNGPSGLTYYPGVGLGDQYANMFFMCDFKGSPARSGVHTIRNTPMGAHFKVEQTGRLVWKTLVTDVEFGFDGHAYISDWVNGWAMTGKGRIYRIANPNQTLSNAPSVQELFRKGFDKINANGLRNLLSHPDMRVRQAAQFQLVAKADTKSLGGIARQGKGLARLHAVWGLGQLARGGQNQDSTLVPLLSDADGEVQTQAAKMLGEARSETAVPGLIELLGSDNARAQVQAAIALSKIGGNYTDAVVAMLRRNDDSDPIVRHGGIMALQALGKALPVVQLSRDKSAAVRLATLIALRREGNPAVTTFLADAQPHIVLEAARAIADEHIDVAMPKLAKLAAQPKLGKSVMRRALNANYRLGQADALAAVAAEDQHADLARGEALNLLGAWAKPSGRDRISGLWRPVADRDNKGAAAALRDKIDGLLRNATGVVQMEAIGAARRLRLEEAGPALLAIVKNKQGGRARTEALKALGELETDQLAEAVEIASASRDGRLRQEATRLAPKVKPADAMGRLVKVLQTGSIGEKQSAILAMGDLKDGSADKVLAGLLDDLLAKKVSAPLQLEVLEAAAKRKDKTVAAKLAKFEASRPTPAENFFALEPYLETLEGGDVAKGKKSFFENVAISCARCHQVGNQGGEVGPRLDGIGAKVDRKHLLESIVNPGAQIAEGFDFFLVTLKNGKSVAGITRKETKTDITLNSPEDGLVTIKKADIKTKQKGPSGMPPGLQAVISKRELRDVIEYLASLRQAPK